MNNETSCNSSTFFPQNQPFETTSDIRARESKQLRDYLKRLSRPDHRVFISDVIKKAGVERKIFYNWKYGNSRMPSFAKAIIQQLAGCTIFSPACDEMDATFIPDNLDCAGS